MNRRYFFWYVGVGILGSSCSSLPTRLSSSNLDPQWPKALRFSVTDVFGLEELKADYGVFTQALEQVLEVPVKLIAVNNLVAAAPALLANQLDLVLAGPSEYLILKARAKAVPVIAVTRPGYFTVVSVLADSGITNLKQLRGKRIGMRAEGAGASHLGTTQLLIEAGLDPKTDFETVMVGDRGVELMLSGEIDAWGDAVARWQRFTDQAQVSEETLAIIARGQPLPSDIFVGNSHLSASFVAHLQTVMLENQALLLEAMLKSPANAKYKDSEMVLGKDADYNQMRELYKAIGQESLIK